VTLTPTYIFLSKFYIKIICSNKIFKIYHFWFWGSNGVQKGSYMYVTYDTFIKSMKWKTKKNVTTSEQFQNPICIGKSWKQRQNQYPLNRHIYDRSLSWHSIWHWLYVDFDFYFSCLWRHSCRGYIAVTLSVIVIGSKIRLTLVLRLLNL
jgi:hypothetical protein